MDLCFSICFHVEYVGAYRRLICLVVIEFLLVFLALSVAVGGENTYISWESPHGMREKDIQKSVTECFMIIPFFSLFCAALVSTNQSFFRSIPDSRCRLSD